MKFVTLQLEDPTKKTTEDGIKKVNFFLYKSLEHEQNESAAVCFEPSCAILILAHNLIIMKEKITSETQSVYESFFMIVMSFGQRDLA